MLLSMLIIGRQGILFPIHTPAKVQAKIGRISDEAVFYLMSRGLSESDAKAMIVSGFANPVSKELPLEYAAEMNNLIKLEMEGM